VFDFANLSLICLGAILVGIGGHSVLASPRGKGPFSMAVRAVREIPALIPGWDQSIVIWLIRLASLAAIGSFGALFLTGFGPAFLGLRLAGYLLIAHVTCAPVFVVSVAFLILVRTKANAFVRANAEPLLDLLKVPVQEPLQPGDTGLVAKGCFWAIAVLSLPLVLSSVLSMFPLFGTAGQQLLFEVHRCCALAVSLFVLVHAYATVRHRVTRDIVVHG